MALFKISRGVAANLPEEMHDGYCWFTTDDSSFYIDFTDESGVIQRRKLNARDAETLTGASLATILQSSDIEIPTSKAVMDAFASYSPTFIATYDATSHSDIQNAHASGMTVVCVKDNFQYSLIACTDSTAIFSYSYGNTINYLREANDVWTYTTTTLQSKLTFDETPTADSDNVVSSGGIFDAINSIGSVVEQNNGLAQKFWRGTKDEFDAIETKADDTMYIITDDEGNAFDITATEVPYDNTTSGLTATTTQAAIDEVVGKVVQPDWSQNDSTASDYVKNRTHYTEINDTLTWDGTTGDITVSAYTGYFTKISDIVLAVSDCSNGITVVMSDGTVNEITYDDIQSGDLGDGCFSGHGFTIIPYDGYIDPDNKKYPEAGFYAYRASNHDSVAYPASFTIHGYAVSEVVVPLDEKYLPDSIKPFMTRITLSPASWDATALTQSVTVTGISADETAQIIQCAPYGASMSVAVESGIYCSGQAADSLTFTCTSVPTEDVQFVVSWQDCVWVEPPAPLITFYYEGYYTDYLGNEDIVNDTLQAEEGMTWAEWIASPYNIYGDKMGIDVDNIVYYAFSTDNSGLDINIYNDYASDESVVYGDDVIIPNHNYYSPPTSE